jgi:hypothetical protein
MYDKSYCYVCDDCNKAFPCLPTGAHPERFQDHCPYCNSTKLQAFSCSPERVPPVSTAYWTETSWTIWRMEQRRRQRRLDQCNAFLSAQGHYHVEEENNPFLS